MGLIEFDLAVIAYAHSRGEESAAVYQRIDRLPNPKGYRERYTEQELLDKLEVVKGQDEMRAASYGPTPLG